MSCENFNLPDGRFRGLLRRALILPRRGISLLALFRRGRLLASRLQSSPVGRKRHAVVARESHQAPSRHPGRTGLESKPRRTPRRARASKTRNPPKQAPYCQQDHPDQTGEMEMLDMISPSPSFSERCDRTKPLFRSLPALTRRASQRTGRNGTNRPAPARQCRTPLSDLYAWRREMRQSNVRVFVLVRRHSARDLEWNVARCRASRDQVRLEQPQPVRARPQHLGKIENVIHIIISPRTPAHVLRVAKRPRPQHRPTVRRLHLHT